MMKVIYDNGVTKREVAVENFYKEIAQMLVKEDVPDDGMEVTVTSELGKVRYKLTYLASLKIQELENTMPPYKENLKEAYLVKNIVGKKHKFYKIIPDSEEIIVEYGSKKDKDSIFSEPRAFRYPNTMYWTKYYEKISNGFVNVENLNFMKRRMLL